MYTQWLLRNLLTDWNGYQQREMKKDRIPSFTHAAFFSLVAYINEQVRTGLPFVSYCFLFF